MSREMQSQSLLKSARRAAALIITAALLPWALPGESFGELPDNKCGRCREVHSKTCGEQCAAAKTEYGQRRCGETCLIERCGSDCLGAVAAAAPARTITTSAEELLLPAPETCDDCIREQRAKECADICLKRDSGDLTECRNSCARSQCAELCAAEPAPAPGGGPGASCISCREEAQPGCLDACAKRENIGGETACREACIEDSCLTPCFSGV